MEDPGGLLNFEQNLILSVNIVFNLQVPRPNLRDIVGIPQPRMIWTNLSNPQGRRVTTKILAQVITFSYFVGSLGAVSASQTGVRKP